MGYPTTSDGKPVHLVNLFPGNILVNYAGSGGDITNGVRLGGSLFNLSKTIAGDASLTFQFIDWVYLAGGAVHYRNANLGDYISFSLTAPATAGTSNPGSGAYSKYSVGGGINMFIPGGGDWDLDLEETLNANVGFTKVVPVPAINSDGGQYGWFDWNEETEAVTLNANGEGAFNLFDANIPLANFASRVPLLGEGESGLTVPAIKPKRILAHWQMTVLLHNAGGLDTLEAVWYLFTGRRSTT